MTPAPGYPRCLRSCRMQHNDSPWHCQSCCPCPTPLTVTGQAASHCRRRRRGGRGGRGFDTLSSVRVTVTVCGPGGRGLLGPEGSLHYHDTLSKSSRSLEATVTLSAPIPRPRPGESKFLITIIVLVTTGPHGRFDIPPAINITHNPTAFITSILPYGSDGMSSSQLSLYLILILGLPKPPMLNRDGACPCGAPHSIFGYHQLNCKHWAGKSWHEGHDLCVKALAYETRRLGLGAVD